MRRMRRWLRRTIAKVFTAALLGALLTPSLQACPLQVQGVAMAYAQRDMPDPCMGMSKQACLAAYVQADQVSSDSVAKAPPAPNGALTQRIARTSTRPAPCEIATSEPSVHSGAPPPRLLYCRMLE